MTIIEPVPGLRMDVTGIPDHYWKDVDPNRIDREAAAQCWLHEGWGEPCTGWIVIAIEGDTSHDWIMRHDECQYVEGREWQPTDEDACALAALETGKTMAWAPDPHLKGDTDENSLLYYAPYLMKE